ncbi:MAG: D-xylose transport system substrate-binding protein, partial [Streptomycetaceae bacterium]|nr:D-xylose transport system substrate-binding protein [Streptomycetaceae bacterium]
MNAMMRRVVIGTAAVSMALSMAACGKAGSNKSSGASVSNGFKIGLALPENQTARYEAVDRPMIVKKVKELCPKCTVEYQNASQNANTQQQQIDTLINDGVKVIILDSVDSKAIQSSVTKAHNKGIKVVAYDRLAQGPLDAYVSFDNTKVGELQGQGLVDCLAGKPANVVFLNGSPTDNNATLFTSGAHSAIDKTPSIKVVGEQAVPDWDNDKAVTIFEQMYTAADGRIDGVYAANDGLAGSVISILEKNKRAGQVPVTGQDATVEGLQNVLAGKQCMTVYKSAKEEAGALAKAAIALVKGESVSASGTSRDDKGNRDVP